MSAGNCSPAPELKGIPVFGEVEIAFWYCPLPMLAVTGTNGKSTTVSLLGQMLDEAGIKNKVAGNIGNALCGAVRNLTDEAVIVAEISSFQLHTVESFHPRVALLLNLSPDHLERYDTLEQYYRSKFRMFERMGKGDLAVLNADDPAVVKRAELAGSVPPAWFSLAPNAPGLVFVAGETLRMRTPGGGSVDIIELKHVRLKGRHNLQNILAASSAAAACGARCRCYRQRLPGFQRPSPPSRTRRSYGRSILVQRFQSHHGRFRVGGAGELCRPPGGDYGRPP